MSIKEVGKLIPLILISKLRHTTLLLIKDPGVCTSIFLPKREQENLFWATKLQEIKEWEAPESNKITAGMLLIEKYTDDHFGVFLSFICGEVIDVPGDVLLVRV